MPLLTQYIGWLNKHFQYNFWILLIFHFNTKLASPRRPFRNIIMNNEGTIKGSETLTRVGYFTCSSSHRNQPQPRPKSKTVNLSHGAWDYKGMGCVLPCCWRMQTRWNCSPVLNCWVLDTEPAGQVQRLFLRPPNTGAGVATMGWSFAAWASGVNRGCARWKKDLELYEPKMRPEHLAALCYCVYIWVWPCWISWSSTYPSGRACPATSAPFAGALVGANPALWGRSGEKTGKNSHFVTLIQH